ncbi:MAG: hypothetical protein R6W48_01070 [Gaiellaceae bacterium]
MHRPDLRRTILFAVVVLAAGLLAGGVVAARFALPGSTDELDRALRVGALEKVSDIPAAPGTSRRAVFVQRSGGLVCLWDAPSATSLTRQGGCNLESDPLAGGELFVAFSFDGGPAIADVTDARLIGLASADVARVQVVMSDGSRRAAPVTRARIGSSEYRSFGYRIRPSDLRRAIGPTGVVALDASGREIDREETGFDE